MSYILVEFSCPACGRFESLVHRPAPPSVKHDCGEVAGRAISAVKSKTCWASAATRGKPDPAPRPTATDTIPLGEGMPRRDWKEARRKVWRDHDRIKRRAKGAPV